MFVVRLRAIALALVVSVVALGCEDPSNVGLDVVGEIGGDPVIRTLAPAIGVPPTEEVTGNNARFLVGHLADPLLGAVRANAYVDFGAMVGSTSFRAGTVSSASLEMRRNYFAGDTLGTIEISLYDMPAEWNAQGATSDTSLVHGDLISTYTISAQDTVVTLPLPQSWIAANDTTLRSEAFTSVFHGFHLEANAGNSILGFATTQTSLRAVAGTDSVSFPRVRDLTTTERLSDPSGSEDYVVLRATAGPIIELGYDLGDVIDQFAVNRATLRVREDSVRAMSDLPPHFVRPRPTLLNLYFRTHDGNLLLIETAARQDNGDFFFRSTDLFVLAEQLVRGQREPGTFELRLPSTPNTLDHLLVRRDEGADPGLRLVLTPLLD